MSFLLSLKKSASTNFHAKPVRSFINRSYSRTISVWQKRSWMKWKRMTSRTGIWQVVFYPSIWFLLASCQTMMGWATLWRRHLSVWKWSHLCPIPPFLGHRWLRFWCSRFWLFRFRRKEKWLLFFHLLHLERAVYAVGLISDKVL